MTADATPQQPPEDRYAPTVWGAPKATTEPEFEELEVPSGQRCLVRRPGVLNLQRAGALTSVDSLTAAVAKYVNADGRITRERVEEMAKSAEAIAEMTRTIDRVVVAIVAKPELQITPEDWTNRQAGVIYTDTIDMTDRVYLFNFAVAGVRDLERFRRGTDALMDALAPEPGLVDTAERAAARYGAAGGVVPEPGGARVRKQPGDRLVKGGGRGTKPAARKPVATADAGPVA